MNSIDFLTAEAVSAMLAMDEELEAYEAMHALLAFRLPAGGKAYPSFQFAETGFNPELISLFQKFPKAMSGWEIACWFYAPNKFIGVQPVTVIGKGAWWERLALVVTTEFSLKEL